MIPFPPTSSWVAQSVIPLFALMFNNATGSINAFNVFKQNPVFLAPTGFTAADYASLCLSHSKACVSASILPVSAARNDTYGSPFSFGIGGGRTAGWDTCRFFDTVAHCTEFFTGSLTGKTVYEWGSNYGGLALSMFDQFHSMSYYMNDLPEVVSFSQYYLSANNGGSPPIGVVPDITGSLDYTGSIDLFIAEYSMTEMDSGSMYAIYQNYAKPANGIFIRCNLQDNVSYNQFLSTCQQDFTCSVINEWQDMSTGILRNNSRVGNRIIMGYKSGSW